jgi:hypothetical protein
MEILRAVLILAAAIGAVFGLAYWKDRRAKVKDGKGKGNCCS